MITVKSVFPSQTPPVPAQNQTPAKPAAVGTTLTPQQMRAVSGGVPVVRWK